MRSVLAAFAGLALMGAAPAPSAPTAPYLSPSQEPDTYRILPPAPVVGTSRYEADRTIYLQTRRYKDTPRWALAQADVDEKAILKDMACALGVDLTPQTAPRTNALITRMRLDVRRAVNRPKDLYKRQRPYLIDEGPICVEKTDSLAQSPDYPSGHATWGWSVGLVLAELAPERSTEVLVRARAFGESRLVCGVHNLSALEAARTNASALVAALHGSAEFRRDMDAARREVAAARKAATAPAAACAAEAELVSKSPY